MAKNFKITMAAPRKALLQKMERAFQEVNEIDLEEAFNFEIASPVWNWPGETVRSKGVVAGSPRNIIDSGDLLDSYDRQRTDKTQYLHAWRVPYAAANHDGAALRSGAVIIPRPWTDRPVEALPGMFARRFRALP